MLRIMPEEGRRGVSTLFERVLVPLDGSRAAEAVLDPITRLLGSRLKELILVHAVTPAEWFSTSATRFVSAERRRADAYLARLAARLAAKGLRIRARNFAGEASGVIVGTARRDQAGLIAMSTHGRGGVRDWAFGSVTERVLRSADRPVLVFHGREERSLSIREIVVALDGSEPSMAVMPAVCDAATAAEASVVLLHAGDRPPSDSRPAAEMLAGSGIRWQMLTRRGDAAAHILETAEAVRADLIAMAIHGGRRDLLDEVLRKARCPLLLVRAAGEGPR